MTEDNTVQAPGTAVVEKDGSTTKASSNDDLGKEARMPSKVSKDFLFVSLLHQNFPSFFGCLRFCSRHRFNLLMDQKDSNSF